MAPIHDLDGNILQDMLDEKALDYITCSIIASGSQGKIVFAWAKDSIPCKTFISSINAISNDELPNVIIRFIFSFFENIYFSPSWWNELTRNVQEAIIKKFQVGSPHVGVDPYCLRPDGIKYVNWNIISRECNFK